MPREGEPARADMAEVVGQQDPSAMPRLVDRLHRLAEGGDEITFDRLVRCIGAQGHAPLMMVAATLMILPTGLIPGVGGVLGTLVAIVGVQMLIGRQRVWLPGILGRRTLPADRVRALAGRIRPPAEWLRRHLHVR